MIPIKFCHIAPIKYLDLYTRSNGTHLLLAHLVEESPAYGNYYAELLDGKYKILDNSAFEMFKQGREMYDSSKLVEMANKSNADCIVLSDYPKQPWSVTMNKAKEMIPEIIDNGFDTFYVPQSELGDMDGLIRSIEWALDHPLIKTIGLSILSCPIACGVNESAHVAGAPRSETYRMQRYLSRFKVLRELDKRGITSDSLAAKRFHCLGMMDGPNEIELLRPYHKNIDSWDSSAAVWCGINGIRFDNSPTGLAGGKFEKEVDFHYNPPYKVDFHYNPPYNEHHPSAHSDVLCNIAFIENLTSETL